MQHVGKFRCTNKEIAGTPNQLVLCFRASTKEFGGNIIVRLPKNVKFELNKEYDVYLEEAE